MLNTLYPEINWHEIKCVGFDLDGTLYDESDFVQQAYINIARLFEDVVNIPADIIHKELFSQWQAKGSSYPFIYSEYLQRYNVAPQTMQPIIRQAVNLYRNTKPQLQLPQSSRTLLNKLASQASLFLVTDGQLSTQKHKVAALGLSDWFSETDIVYTSTHGSNAAKPSTLVLSELNILRGISPNQVVFFGDRDVDSAFAKAAGFEFCYRNMKTTGNEK